MFFKELATKQFVGNININRDNVKDVLSKRSKKIRRIINETNVLIDEHVTPFLNDPTSISRQEAEEFQDFAEKLSGYRESVDTGLSYEIRNALIEYSEFIEDDELYIHNMFYKGLALFYLDRYIFKPEMSECYAKVLSFSDRYEEFSTDTRNLICRAHGNYYISVADYDIDEIYRRYDIAGDFWENVGRKFDPDFPWDAYEHNLHENICSTTITILRADGHAHKVKDVHKKRLLESAKLLYDKSMNNEEVQSNDYTSVQVKHIYYYETAKYYNKIITVTQFLQKLYELYKQGSDDYDYDDLYKNIQISALYLYYLSHDPPKELSEKEQDEIILEIEKDVLKYIENIPENVSQSHVTMMIANFALGSQHVFNYTTYLKLLLSLTVFRHLPTYVHSVMVAKVSYIITEYLIKYMPEILVGMPGINTVEDVKDQADEILKFVWYCGLIHDIGKIVYSHLVSFYVRKLNDKEFQMIKEHSSKADNFIKPTHNYETDEMMIKSVKNAASAQLANNQELFACFSDIAFGHHKSYDGKFGYPPDFDNLASPVKVIIDIVSIADSIDAATDSVGRSYATEKFLSDMEEDLLSQIDTRYNPIVTKAIFENKELYDAIDGAINEFRYDVYYSCFSDNDFSKTMIPPEEATF